MRGIHATVRARVNEPIHDPMALYREAYAGRPFVRVTGAPPELSAVVGTYFAHVHALARDGGRVVIATLFAANPFGRHDFESLPDKTAGNLVVPAGESVTFRYRFYVHEGDEKQSKVAERYAEYVKSVPGTLK